MRPKIDYRSTSKAAYLAFREQYPNEDISFADYKNILLQFNRRIIAHILQTGEKIKLPFGLGELSIAKYTPRREKTFMDKNGKLTTIPGLPINWQKTREHGKIIYHLNSHTDGYKYRFKWFKTKARFAGSSCFGFKPNRIASRALAYSLKNDPRSYQIYRQWLE